MYANHRAALGPPGVLFMQCVAFFGKAHSLFGVHIGDAVLANNLTGATNMLNRFGAFAVAGGLALLGIVSQPLSGG